METLWQDVKYGARMLGRSPGFTAVAVLTLALGIGANTALFSVVNAVLLRPLPFPQPDRLVQLWASDRRQDDDRSSISPYDFADWRRQNQTFEHLAAYAYEALTLTSGEHPERVVAILVSDSFFSVLGIRPLLGRDFRPEEDAPGRNRVIILSHEYWQRRFGSDNKLVGQSLTLNGESFTVVGIAPPGFRFPQSAELWTPLGTDFNRVPRGTTYLFAIGRLRPGVDRQTAQAEMDTIADRLERQYPGTNTGRGVRVVPLHEELVGNIRLQLFVLLGAVGLVLLIACGNVANLLLVRAAVREREIAVRAALGASRRRLVRHFLTESALLAGIAGSLGLLVALWGTDLLVALSPGDIPRRSEIGVDAWVLGFTLFLAFLTAGLFGLAPALQAAQQDLNQALKESGLRATAGRGRQRLRHLLIVAEIALALTLLIGAGLLIKSFVRLQQVHPGFNPENVLTARVSLSRTKYPRGQEQAAFFQQVLDRIEALPGVQSAGAITDLPFSGSRTSSTFEIEGRPSGEPYESLQADRRAISSDYFRAMGVRMVAGRTFTARDTKEEPGVAIVNEAMARRFWPHENPLGKRIRIGAPQETATYGRPIWREIVGVVGNVKHDRLDAEWAPEMYVPYWQHPQLSMALVVRETGDSEIPVAALLSAVQSVDPNQAVYGLSMMEQRLSRSVSMQRFNALLLGFFALAALFLAALGVYGIVSYAVSQRTHEIGIRMALGAQTRDILRLVAGQGMLLASVGVGIGLASAYAFTRLLSGLLFGVSATDPLTFLSIAVVLLVVALLACWVPARRATRVDPVVALRYQ